MPDPPLARACARLGLDASDARLLHARANAVYHLPGPDIVVRLRHAPGNPAVLERSRAAIQITAWLAEQSFATTKPLRADQPVAVDGWVVTAWHYVTGPAESRPGPEQVAYLLRRLHRMDPPTPAPILELLGTLRADLDHDADRRLRRQTLTPDQRAWLVDRCEQVEASYARLDPPLGYGLIHGDAHTGNLFADRSRWVLGDWDSIAHGPHLQDLIPIMMGHRRFGRPRSRWISFCRAYGIDPGLENHPAADTLRAAREIRSLAAYIRSADQPAIAAELQRRLTSLLEGTSITWRPV